MDAGGNIYELGEGLAALRGDETTLTDEQLVTVREDVARLDGFLKGRAESDRRAHERLVHDSTKDGTYRKP